MIAQIVYVQYYVTDTGDFRKALVDVKLVGKALNVVLEQMNVRQVIVMDMESALVEVAYVYQDSREQIVKSLIAWIRVAVVTVLALMVNVGVKSDGEDLIAVMLTQDLVNSSPLALVMEFTIWTQRNVFVFRNGRVLNVQ